MKKLQLLLILLFAITSVIGQNINPDEDEIYREGEVAIIRLIMSESDKAFMLDDANVWSEEYLPTSFQFTNSQMDTLLTFNVGVRLRGNSSRSHPKRSFKIKFKEYDGEKFFGYKKFNLKAENNDPSMVREMLTLQTFRNENVPAARTHHVEVYINDEYMGIYLNVEQLDDEFTKSRFTYDEGNLYKCTWGANLLDDGQIYDNGIYELKTNKSDNDRSILDAFVKVLNNTSESDFEIEIEKVFNVDKFIKYLAVETLTGHWDGYSYNMNNFYLYENEDGRIEFIPYDVDNTFGIDWVDRDWGTRDVLDWASHGDARPLTKRILARGKYMYDYKVTLDSMLNEDFSEAYFFPEFDKHKSLLADAFSRDLYFPLTFGFTYADFENSDSQEVISHAPYGLKPYITTRTTLAREQIGTITDVPNPLGIDVTLYPNPSSGNSILIKTSELLNYSNLSVKNAQGRDISFSISSQNDNIKVRFDSFLSVGMYVLLIDGKPKKFMVR